MSFEESNVQERNALSDPEAGMLSLTELMHARLDIPSPFMKNIFLLSQAIVGTRYLGGSDELVKDLKPGSRISFVAEPDNPYDEHAVMALDSQGRKLGYIPKHENAIIKALLKEGKSIYGIMPEKQPGTGKVNRQTPYAIWVDLYMREFLLPDDMSQIPRQGYLGSYAVADFSLTGGQTFASGPKDKTGRAAISEVFAVKVINGEERDTFSGRLSEETAENERELLKQFRDFAGYLPIVGHEIEEAVQPVLEDSYGVLLGIPFSNRVIDTQVMAFNHLPRIRDYSLEALAEELGIEVSADTEAESRCRKTWKLYCRMERSELEKRPAENKEQKDAADRDVIINKLDVPIEDYPVSDRLRVVLRANRILTLRELSGYSVKEISQFRWMDDRCTEELKKAAAAAGASFRPEGIERTLYGYPQRIRRIAVRKGRFWEYLLLFGAIGVYYEWLQHVRSLPVQMWRVQENHLLINSKHEMTVFAGKKLKELRSFLDDFSDAVNAGIQEAVGAPDGTGSAEAVMKAVEDLMAVYKEILIWKRDFQYLYAEPPYREVIEALSGAADDLMAGFDDLYDKSISASEQLEACLAGELETDELHINIDIKADFNAEAINEALNRFAAKQQKGH